MTVAETGDAVRPGDPIAVELPSPPFVPLDCV
jgi:hypothetical protein